EHHPALLHGVGELGPLGQEAVARVDRVGARDLGGRDQVGDVEIALGCGPGTDAHGLVGEAHVQRGLVDGRVHGDGLEPDLAARPNHTQGDLAAIGDEDLAKFAHSRRTLNSLVPNSTGCWLATRTSSITQPNSASISLNSFMASTMHTVVPAE